MYTNVSDKIQKWLRESSLREVKITRHAHGIRVSLSENCENITFSVSESIEVAFENCLQFYPTAKENLQNEKRDRLERECVMIATDLRSKQLRLKEMMKCTT